MIYLKAFRLSKRKIPNTNTYPYNVFLNKECGWMIFEPITVLYGNNASGKSTMLSIIANKLNMTGAERGADINPGFFAFGKTYAFFMIFLKETKQSSRNSSKERRRFSGASDIFQTVIYF